MIRVVKDYRPLGAVDSERQVSTVDIPYEIRDVEAEEYRLHLGTTFNADKICADLREALDEPTICVKICSPFGLDAKALKDPKAVFAHMDPLLMQHGSLGGFHEADRADYNIWHMIDMANRLVKGSDEIEIEALVVNQETNKLEPKKVAIPNFMGFVNVVSANKMWQRCISWLPFATDQGSPRMLFGATLLCAMTDPRWYVNPARGYHRDVTLLRKYFGLGKLVDSANIQSAAHSRSLIAINTWWWMPHTDDRNIIKQPNMYFHRLFQRYTKQLANRYPVQLASNVAITLTTVKFLSFIWLTWMYILCNEPVFQFDAYKFFDGDKAAAEDFLQHYHDNL